MRMAAAELFELALKLHDWFGNGRCALSPAQDQPSSPADSTYQAQLNGVTHACRKLTEQFPGTGREVRAFRSAIARQNSLDTGCSLYIGCEISVVRCRRGNRSRDKSVAVVAYP